MVADEAVHALYGNAVQESLGNAGFHVVTHLLSPRESEKNLETVHAVVTVAAASELSWADIFLSLGGALTADITGMAAAIYQGGVPYVRVLTTLRGAVEASISPQVYLNLGQNHSLLGVQSLPLLAVCDCDTFGTLPREAYQDGVAECLRYGLLYDRALFELVSRGTLDEDCLSIVTQCVQIGAQDVERAEQSELSRRSLSMGKTMARAVQTLSGDTMSHGHAISIGMVGSSRLSEALGLCVMGITGIIMAMLDRLDLPSETSFDADTLARTVAGERIRYDDEMALALPDSIGHCRLETVRVQDLPRIFRLAKGERA